MLPDQRKAGRTVVEISDAAPSTRVVARSAIPRIQALAVRARIAVACGARGGHVGEPRRSLAGSPVATRARSAGVLPDKRKAGHSMIEVGYVIPACG